MTDTETNKLEKSQNKRLWIGRILSGISILMSLVLGIWQAYLLPITNSLSAQGRLHKGDSDGCFYGLLFILTVFISPVVTLVALVQDVPLGSADSIYLKIGDLLGWVALAGVAFFTFFSNKLVKKEEK